MEMIVDAGRIWILEVGPNILVVENQIYLLVRQLNLLHLVPLRVLELLNGQQVLVGPPFLQLNARLVLAFKELVFLLLLDNLVVLLFALVVASIFQVILDALVVSLDPPNMVNVIPLVPLVQIL